MEFKNCADKSENVRYNNPDFPLYMRRSLLSSYPDFSAASHWHDDVEFIVVLSGFMEYNVNGVTVLLHPGEGIFVNTRQLHYGFSAAREECVFLCFLIHPVLLCSSAYVEQQFVAPVLENEAMPYLVLHPGQQQEQDILELLVQLYQCPEEKLLALRAQSLFFAIWEKLFLLSDVMERTPLPGSRQLFLLKDMIRFLCQNYTEKISLAQISRAGGVGKTTCCAIFQKYTNKTPIAYLTAYRLKKSVELLETTDKTVSEICFETGFSSASYFAEVFRRTYGRTPTQYRAAAPDPKLCPACAVP